MFTCGPALLSPPWSPLSLFGAGEPGGWYDPSDMATMCRDPTGQLPVYSANNTVGLMLDKRFGLKTTTEIIGATSMGGPFTGLGNWVNTTSATTLTLVNGEIRARLQNSNSTWWLRLASQNLVGGLTYKIAVTVRQSATFAQGGVALSLYNQTTATSVGSTTLTQLLESTEVVMYYTPPANGAFSIIVAGSNNAADFGKDIFLLKASCAVLPGAHLVQSTAASRPTLRYASGLWYLEFDGVDDFLSSTNNVDFSATDKLGVFAGIKKINDSASGSIANLGSNVNLNAFELTAPNVPSTTDAAFRISGTGSAVRRMLTAPISTEFVITGLGDLSGATISDEVVTRINGVVSTTAATGTASTGALGNAAMYVGRRSGTSIPYAGNLYGLVIRGAATDAVNIAAAERYLAKKSGVTL